MQTITLTINRPHPAQLRVIQDAARYNVLACGRRWGKTELCIHQAIAPDVLSYPVAWFTPTYKDMLEVWRTCTRILEPITGRSSASERRIENIAGGVLEFWSLDNPQAGRGRKYKRVVVDEAAFVPHLLESWQSAIRPTLIDLGGDAWFPSTPKGHNGFWQMYQWGIDPEASDWRAWKSPTRDNPYIDPAEIEEARRTMPERLFAQEILAEFLDDAGGVFRRVVDAATAVPQASGDRTRQYVIGVDWAQSIDFTVFVVIDVAERMVVHMDRFNQIDYTVQRGRLQALATRFRPSAIIAEENSIGRPIIEQLQRDGLPVTPFTTTNATKTAAIDALALAFEQGNIRIPNDPVLIGELQAYEMSTTATGLRRFSAPEGMHDDTVMALALAWTGIGVGHLPAAMTQDSLWTSKASKALPPARPGRWRKY